MPSATIKLFLVAGEPKGLRTAEMSNWNGKAVAGPRSDLANLLSRQEAAGSGVYLLTGVNPETGRPTVYVGEAELIRNRVKNHVGLEFWNHAVYFVGNENLTKAHVRYLERRLIELAKQVGRADVVNEKGSGARLPESDTADMEIFLEKIHQLLPVLGVEVFVPVTTIAKTSDDIGLLSCEIKGLKATGRLTPNGMVVLGGSQAVLNERPSTQKYPWSLEMRQKLKSDGALVERKEHLEFATNVEFTSPSAAAAVIHGGQANGLTAWKNSKGRTLKDLESAS
jgi:Domain of unknown function (DUF4357)